MTTVNSAWGDFAGRVAVVTGGAGGIGRAVCAGFADAGARAISVDLAGADYNADVSDPAAMREVMRRVHADHGGPHVLATLAGGSLGTPRDLEDITPEDVDAVLDVNVKGTLYACRAALPYLREGRGCVVACTSIGARQPSPVTGVPYAAAKAAVGGLVRRLAAEAGPFGVRVNAVAPGLFPTPRVQRMFDALPESERTGVVDAIALRRMPTLTEIVDPILFLAGDGASYITGVTLDVNGGRYMPL
ncbi:MAG: SDR family NAD(P)-dependent oxidoreductase [Stackebrandtia sp.]